MWESPKDGRERGREREQERERVRESERESVREQKINHSCIHKCIHLCYFTLSALPLTTGVPDLKTNKQTTTKTVYSVKRADAAKVKVPPASTKEPVSKLSPEQGR